MKLIYLSLILLINTISFTSRADTEIFVQTISNTSAKDAITIGPDENLYSSNYNTGIIYRVTPEGEVSIVLEANNGGPAGIRFDQNGEMLVAMYNIGEVVKVTDGVTETFSSNVREPIALDWDSAGNLYVSNFGGSTTVTKISPDGTPENFASISQMSRVSSLCLDDQDNIFVTSANNGDVYKITPSGDISLFASTGTGGIGFIQYDRTNNKFYATILQANKIMEIDANGNHQLLIDSSNSGVQDGPLDIATIEPPLGLAVSRDGNSIYFATQNHIRRAVFADPGLDQIAPYFTSTPITGATQDSEYKYELAYDDPNGDTLDLTFFSLPSWLSFDGVSTISGTPSANDTGASYEVVASLTDGTSTVTQSFKISVTNVSSPAPQPSTNPSGSGGGGGIKILLLLLVTIVFMKKILKLS